MAFVIISGVVWSVMNSLAEMTAYLPVQGVSVPYYLNRFFEPSLAFAAGWNYWYSYAMLVAAEVSAASVVIQYWTTSVPVAVWITIILVVIVCLNTFVVSWYGESEFWFASIKIIAIIGLIILGIVLFFGGGPNHDRLGFRYWKNPPGAFKSYAAPGNTGKFLAFWTALIRSGFAFVLSPELVTIAAGETEAPRRNIPKAGRRFIYRLIVFYILGTLVISVIVSSDDPDLLKAVSSGKTNAGASPFVLGIQRAGIPVLNHIINGVILTSAWSAGNSFLFAGSRSLYSLAITNQAPKIFRTCNKHGVPYVAVLFTAALACLVYLSVSAGSASVFTWFLNLTTISGFIAWVVLFMGYLVSFTFHWINHVCGQTNRACAHVAVSKSSDLPQHAGCKALQDAVTTIFDLGDYDFTSPSLLDERIPSFLPWKILRSKFPRSLYYNSNLRCAVPRAQDMVPDSMGLSSVEDRYL